MMQVAVLDDYQRAALKLADWKSLEPGVLVEAFPEHIADPAELAKRLHVFECVVLMRERTLFPKTLIDKLPNLRLIVTAGMRNAAIDVEAATARGIQICGTETLGYPTAELTWGLIIALARKIPEEWASLRAGQWQSRLGTGLKGKVLGVVGLGRLGGQVASIGKAFGMEVIAWSPNLTAAKAEEAGAVLVGKSDLMSGADVISVHMVLSPRTRGLIGAEDIACMKQGAILINTSRGPLIDEAALLAAVQAGKIIAALDVYDREPLPEDHPLRASDHTVLTPHLGYGVEETWRQFYPQSVENAEAFLNGNPIRVLNAQKSQDGQIEADEPARRS
jgi:phosphoglycerate dehydrogenase-like enzyme